ncbi:MAG: hypothetical protein V5A68_00330 [Candidatus Thermoplasmatota archaeon]
MDEKAKKELLEEFEDSDGGKRLDMWDFALGQKVLWEKIIAEMQKIAKEQNVDKKIDKMLEKELKEKVEQ